jgi:hypothetical protein
VTVPPTVAPGEIFEVDWRGADAPGDFIAVAEEGAAAAKFLFYARTSRGAPALLTAPGEGVYEIRYVAASGLEIMARAQLAVGVISAALNAAAEVEAGAPVTVTVSTSGDAADYITIVEAGATDIALGDYERLRGATVVALPAPDQAGSYEIRHIRARDQVIISRAPLTVRKAAAAGGADPGGAAITGVAVEAPAPTGSVAGQPPNASAGAAAGLTLMALVVVDHAKAFHVAWTGPGADGAVIGLAPAGGDGEALVVSAPADDGIVALSAPDAPGDYVLLFVDARGAVLARRAIEVW